MWDSVLVCQKKQLCFYFLVCKKTDKKPHTCSKAYERLTHTHTQIKAHTQIQTLTKTKLIPHKVLTCSKSIINFDDNPRWSQTWAKQQQQLSCFPTHNEGIGSLWALEKCSKKPFCECSHLWNFKRTSCKQDWGEQILSHSPLPSRISLSSLFSIFFPLCFAFSLGSMTLKLSVSQLASPSHCRSVLLPHSTFRPSLTCPQSTLLT